MGMCGGGSAAQWAALLARRVGACDMKYPHGVYGCDIAKRTSTHRENATMHAVLHALSIAGAMTWEIT